MEKTVKQMYRSGLGAPTIAKEFGISSTKVYKILKSGGIIPKLEIANRRRNRIGAFTPKQDWEIARLYKNKKMSLSALSKRYGHCIGAIRNALKRERVEMSPRGNRYREFSQKELSDIIARYRNGESQGKIATAYKTHQIIISRILRSNGVSPDRRYAQGNNHGMWKGGSITISGYRYICLPMTHRFRKMANRVGYVAEHRLIMAEHLDRLLNPRETVHHLNGIRTDNRIENLEIRHGKHGKGVILKCADCGSINIISTKQNKNAV